MNSLEFEKKSRPYFPHAFLEQHAQITPEAIAIVNGARQITYNQLDRVANYVGRFLQGCGVGPNVVVGLYMPRSPEIVFGAMGIYKAGGACAFFRFDDAPERLRAAIEQVRPSIILSTRACLPRLAMAACEVFCLDELGPIQEHAYDAPACVLSENDIATLFLTSGTTGTPKAVLFPFGRISIKDEQRSGQQRHILKTDSGTTFTRAEIVHPILTGGAIFIPPLGIERDTSRFIDYIIENEITYLICTPSFLQAMMCQDKFDARIPLRSVICSGEAVPPTLPKDFFQRVNAELTIIYGCTEAPSISSLTLGRSDNSPIISVGKPSEATEIHILDENMCPVPIGEEGEICVSGQIARGYLHDPALTSEKFVTYFDCDKKIKRLFRTGDIGKWLCGGNLQVVGRQDDQVKIRGFRFHLGEVEAHIAAHPSIRFCVVVVHEHGVYGKRIAAFYGRKTDSYISANDLRRFLKRLVPPEMIPHAFIEISKLPLTTNGKIDRSILRHRAATLSAPVTSLQTSDRLQQLVAGLWERVIGCAVPDVDTNFFDSGGDSVSLSMMILQFEGQFGIDFPGIALSDLTIRGLASALGVEDKVPSNPQIIPLKSGTRSPIFFAPGGYDRGGVGGSYPLTTKLDVQQPAYELAPPESSLSEPSITTIAMSCIQAMKAVQREGPYTLAGFSNGGVVALEMAQLLSRNNETVARLILIDSYLSSAYYNGLWVRGLAAGLKGKKVQLRSRFIFRVERFLDRRKTLPESDLQKLNYHIHRAYTPQKYHGRVDFLYAQESSWRACHDLLGWHGLLCGKLRLREFAGSHLGLISRPVADDVSEELQKILSIDD